MSKLLDCPFCAADHQSVKYNISEQVVGCGCCGAIGPDTMFGSSNRESAIAAWNSRTPIDDATDAEILEISTLYGGSKFSSTDEHGILFEVSNFLAFVHAITGSQK
jgi:uncharacterized Zn finger protein